MNKLQLNTLSKDIIGAAIEVHRILGPGLLEHAYRAALAHELRLRGHKADEEVPLPVTYKGIQLDTAFRADILVDNEIILELKATEKDHPLYAQQLLTYLQVTDKRLGLLINFNRPTLIEGLQRIVHHL